MASAKPDASRSQLQRRFFLRPLSQSETAMEKANPMYGSLYNSFPQYFGSQPWTAGPVYVGAFVLFLFVLGCFIVKAP